MNKALIFAGGLVIGAAVGSGITYLITMKQVKEGIEETKDSVRRSLSNHEDAISCDADELRDYYIQQLRDLGVGVYDAEEDEVPEDVYRSLHRTRVNPLPDEDDEDEDDIYDEDDAPAPIDPNPFPYIITGDDFDTNDDYSTCTVHYYKDDKVFTTDDHEIITDPDGLFGRTMEDIKNSPLEAVYVRNEYQTCDYEVLIFNDSYAHAVEGEDQLGDMAD